MIIDFYSILPLTCAIFVSLLGLFILLKDPKSRMNQLLFGFNMSMFLWQLGTFMMFALRGNEAAGIFWDRFVYIGVVFMPPFMHHFSLVFTKRAGRQKALLLLNYFLAILSLSASRTDLFVDGLYYYSWGAHTQARILHTVFLGYFFLGTGLFFYNLWTYFRKLTDRLARLQVIYVFVAFAIVIFIGGSAYLFAYNVDTRFPFAYITGLVFPVMLFYAVSRHHLLGTKVVATEVLVGLVEFFIVTQIFFARTAADIISRVLLAVVMAVIGSFLIYFIQKEIHRREEVQRLALELKSANDRLTEIDQAKSDFLSIAAHQLRTPLSIIKGYISMVLAGDYGKVGSKKVHDILDNVYKSNEHLIFLADDFLNIARLESGRVQYNFQETDLAAVVKQIVTEFEGKAKEKGLKLESILRHDLPKLTLDPEKIHHVIFNFLDNAIKYTNKGSVRVELSREADFVTCTVTDTGIGMSHTDQENMFQKFYRGKNVAGLEVNGTGLGLYVSRRFIEAQGGRIWVQSRGSGKGSTFGITLPVKKE